MVKCANGKQWDFAPTRDRPADPIDMKRWRKEQLVACEWRAKQLSVQHYSVFYCANEPIGGWWPERKGKT